MDSLIALIQLELEYLRAECNFAVIPYIFALIFGLVLPAANETPA